MLRISVVLLCRHSMTNSMWEPVSYTHLVDGLELALCLQDQAGGNLPAANGSHQLFQLGDLADVGALVDKAAHMDWQPPAVHVVGFLAQEIEQLGVRCV